MPDAQLVDVEDVLRRYQALTKTALLGYLPSKEPRRHLYDLLPAYPLRGGKGLRPALLIATCRAFGGSADAAIRSAVAVELLHTAFLVHDDIQDGSRRRRGHPSMQVQHGVPIALNVGNTLAMLSLRPLFDNFERLGNLAWQVFAEFEQAVRETLEGQAIELGWVRDNYSAITVADYLRMALKKTASYTVILPCRAGALIGSNGTADLGRLLRFGFFLGAVFQIQDDLLSIVADPRRFGKEIGDDVYEGKRTLMVIHLLEHAPEGDRARLLRVLGCPRSARDGEDVEWVSELMRTHGSLDFARSCLHGMAGAAMHEFEVAFGHLPDSEDKRFIRALVPYLLTRDG